MGLESPVTLDEAKAHLRVVTDDEDQYINALCLAATDWAEKFQNRTFVSRARTMVLDKFATVIRPPHPPLVSVTSIVYVDADGDDQTLSSANYRVDTDSEPGRITVAYGVSWPTIRSVTSAITITYQAGYGKAAAVPDDVKHAIKLMIGHFFEIREPVTEIKMETVPLSVKALLWPSRIVSR
jgi:uncharacterized phiE125 gp8 family phage protein